MSEPHSTSSNYAATMRLPAAAADTPRTATGPEEGGSDSEKGSVLPADDAVLVASRQLPGHGPGDVRQAADQAPEVPNQPKSPGRSPAGRAAWKSPVSSDRAREAGRLPNEGDELFGFQLRQSLGRGAFARVFLAEQADLAGRHVVLKVSAIEGTEPETLAQLQHTHIVPIHSIHEDPDMGLRALCMPYFGGACLWSVLKHLWKTSSRPQTGAELLRSLDAVAAPDPDALRRLRATTPAEPADAGGATERPGHAQTARKVIEGLSYIRAAAWIVTRLADGLHHAHQRGILHRDIKPPNILLGADGQPMLLDFNLAQDTSRSPDRATLGGTIAYMSPEHLSALADRSSRRAARHVDHRADLYALGMVLYEMLAGRGPFAQSARSSSLPTTLRDMASERVKAHPSLRQLRPDVPWNLESIVRRCLHPDPALRYNTAGELSEDLTSFLEDRPLRHAPELSLVERGQKWVRRHPRLTSAGAVGAIAAALLLGTGTALAVLSGRLEESGARLAQARAVEVKRAYHAGALRALFLVETTNDLDEHLRPGLEACREALDLYQVLDRDDWTGHDDWRNLPQQDRPALAEHIRELLLLYAGATVRLAGGEAGAVREALTLLDKAEAVPCERPCRALWEDRAAGLERLGEVSAARQARATAAALPLVTARDHYLLSLSLARDGKHQAALVPLDEAVRLDPRHYWSWMQRGLCRQETGEFTLAAADFGVCVGLWPEFAWGYFNRAFALAACGKTAEAVGDYTRALERDPGLTVAHVNRGLLHLQLRQYRLALADFEAAHSRGREDAAIHSGLGVALEGLGRHAEADAAFLTADARAAGAAQALKKRVAYVYGFAVADRLPHKARAAFDEVLRLDPAEPRALYGQAMLLDRQNDDLGALRYYNKALQADPGFEEARRFRAVLLARLGRFDPARADLNVCLAGDHVSGATYYAAACVAALQAGHEGEPLAAERAAEAIRFLEAAFARGYGSDRAEGDADLRAIRGTDSFARLLRTFKAARVGG